MHGVGSFAALLGELLPRGKTPESCAAPEITATLAARVGNCSVFPWGNFSARGDAYGLGIEKRKLFRGEGGQKGVSSRPRAAVHPCAPKPRHILFPDGSLFPPFLPCFFYPFPA